MRTEDIVWELGKAKNIYDVLVILYEHIDNENSPGYLQEYDRISQSRSWKAVNGLLDELLKEVIDLRRFLREISAFLTEESFLYAVHILQYFNQVFKDKCEYSHLNFGNRISIGNMNELGPLNTIQVKYRLYLSPEGGLLKESRAMKDSKYRLISYRDGSGIFSRINSYYIVPVLEREPEVVVREYKYDIFFSEEKKEKRIRVACIPICKKEWFQIKYIDSASDISYFEVINKDADGKDVNKEYVKLLDRLIDEKVEVIIFPELSMNEQTEQEIKKYLAAKSLQIKECPLKLVFLGSLWKEGKNECVLLSGSGSVLVRNIKKNPFEMKKGGRIYREALKKRPARYELIDVRHLGRILYVVCKDAFEEMDQAAFQNEYEVDIEVISSFSASISLFEDQMKELAQKHLGIGIVANSCCPRLSVGEEIGFIEIPYMRKEKPYKLEGMRAEYKMDEYCMKQCSFAGCAHIFEFRPDEIHEDTERAGITVDYTRNLLK